MFGLPVVGLGRFTKCVSEKDFRLLPDLALDLGPGTLAREGCEFLLGGKLVCLGDVQCAVGRVVHIEPVGWQKKFPDSMDNDFSINLLLYPWRVDDFATGDPAVISSKAMPDKMQGHLITQYTNLKGMGEEDEPNIWPYLLEFERTNGTLEPVEDPLDAIAQSAPPGFGNLLDLFLSIARLAAGKPKPIVQPTDVAEPGHFAVPVLHCEFEGSRVWAVCTALGPFIDLMTGGPGGGCRKSLKWMPWGIGNYVCTAAEWLAAVALAPAALAAALAAWVGAGAADDAAITGPVSGMIHRGEDVVVVGRWVWDGGHQGYNEIHAVHLLQQIVVPPGLTTNDKTAVNEFVGRVCRLVAQIPDPVGAGGTVSGALTPQQQDTRDRQENPANQWVIHPAVDGCQPEDHAPPPDQGAGQIR